MTLREREAAGICKRKLRRTSQTSSGRGYGPWWSVFWTCRNMCGVGRYSVAVSSCWFCSFHTVFSSWLVDRQRRQITSRLHESRDRQHYCLTFCKSEFCYTFVQYKPKKCTFVKLIFKFVFYMFRNREFIFRKKVVRAGMLWYVDMQRNEQCCRWKIVFGTEVWEVVCWQYCLMRTKVTIIRWWSVSRLLKLNILST